MADGTVGKVCTKCGELKEFTDFSVDRAQKTGRRPSCKPCNRARFKAYYAENRDAVRAKNARWAEANPEYYRAKARRPRYEAIGITDDDYVRMWMAQEGRCAICGTEPEQRLAVDHCHRTGRIRGLLCGRCNVALGGFKDNERLLEAALAYLRGGWTT